MARVLDNCMDRYESLTENIVAISSPDTPLTITPGVDEHTQHQWDDKAELMDERTRTNTKEETLYSSATTSNSAAVAENCLNILIVDDNEINRRYESYVCHKLCQKLIQSSLLVAFMKKHRFRYSEAVNGLEALKLYQKTTSPRFDVILMGKNFLLFYLFQYMLS
jgi:CheY-like chemotaxis protein